MRDGQREILNPVFCHQCGNRVEGGAFCVHCGVPVQLERSKMAAVPVGSPGWGSDGDDGAAPSLGHYPVNGPSIATGHTSGWDGAGSSQPAQEQERFRPDIDNAPDFRSRRAVKLGAVGVPVAVIVASVAATVLLLGSSKHTSYRAEASQLVNPVLADTAKVASALETLSPGGNPQVAQSAAATAQDATQVAQQSLALLKPAESQAAMAAQVNAALTSEVTWLQTASAVLAKPSSPLLSQLSGLGLDAATKFQQMETGLLVGTRGTFPSSTQIVLWASSANAAAAADSYRAEAEPACQPGAC